MKYFKRGRRPSLRTRTGALLRTVLALLILPTASAQAAFIVNSTDDVDDGTCDVAHCSLREAVISANMTAGDDTITFALGGVFQLNLVGTPDTEGTGDLDVTDNLTIEGEGCDKTIIDAGGIDRAFDVFGATLTLKDVTIRKGLAEQGAGIFVNGGSTVMLVDSVLTENVAVGTPGNTAVGHGTAIFNNGGTVYLKGTIVTINEAKGDGGAIYNQRVDLVGGVVLVDLSELTGNKAELIGNKAKSGGGIYNRDGTVTVKGGSTLSNNTALDDGSGGGVWNGGMLTLDNAMVTGNFADKEGGGVFNDGELTVEKGTTISGNATSDAGGGGIANHVTCNMMCGAMPCIVSGNSGDFGGGIYNTGDLSLDNTVVDGNFAAERGGGIYSIAAASTVTLTGGSSVVNNHASDGGGGIVNDEGGTLDVGLGTVISNNLGGDAGGGLLNYGTANLLGGNGENEEIIVENNSSSDAGGGILNGTGGTLTVDHTNFLGNSGGDQGGGILNRGTASVDNALFQDNSSTDSGGGIANVITLIPNTTMFVTGDLTVTNSDFISNTGADSGGALFNEGIATVENSCFTDNSGADSGGAVSNAVDGILTLINTDFLTNASFPGSTSQDSGGAVSNLGMLFVSGDFDFTGNAAGDSGGALSNFGTLTPLLGGSSGNFTFTNNTAGDSGGAISNFGDMTLTGGNFTFTNNNAGDSGGAISNFGDMTLTGGNFTFTNNNAGDNGGAISNFDTLTLSGSVLTVTGGSVSDDGGAFINFGMADLANFDSVSFTGGSAGDIGGAIANKGFGELTLCDEFCNATITDNSAESGGGIANSGVRVTLNNVNVDFNRAIEAGGGIYTEFGTLTFVDCSLGCSVSNNMALTKNGGGLYIQGGIAMLDGVSVDDNSAGLNGGGITNQGATVTLEGGSVNTNHAVLDGGGIYNIDEALMTVSMFTTIDGNTADQNGGGLFNLDSMFTSDASVSITGNEALDKGGGIFSKGNATVTLNGADVSSNLPDDIVTE